MKCEHVGYLWKLDNTEGLNGNRPEMEFTFTKVNPFGKAGQDYSRTYPVTCEKLYRAVACAALVAKQEDGT